MLSEILPTIRISAPPTMDLQGIFEQQKPRKGVPIPWLDAYKTKIEDIEWK